jgi:ferritin-like metal-binding protein YciE
VMIEQIEIAQFKTLLILAKGVYHKKIHSMIKLCLDEAMKEKRTYELLSQVYTM